MKKILIATGNQHKAKEIGRILGELEVEWKTTQDFNETTDVEETGKTFEANAQLKAHVWHRNTQLFTIADDSGLEVDAMGGRPGVRSARYAKTPEMRIQKLLAELEGIPTEKRTARFVCVACVVTEDGEEILSRGVVEGRIASEVKGEGGFGYDPVFIPNGFDGRHMAELTDEEKDEVSHRGLAMRGLLPKLRELVAKDGQ